MIAFIKSPTFFPVLIMVLFACAAIRYAAAQQWMQALYWSSAMLLNLAVFFMGAGHE